MACTPASAGSPVGSQPNAMNTFSLRRLAAISMTIGWSEFKLRYAGSAMGYFWSVSKPLIMFAVLYTVFSKVLRFGEGIPYYPLMLLLGIVLWSFFAETTGAGVTVLVAKADLLRKVSFPSIVLPISVAITASLAMAFNVLAVFVFVLGNDLTPTWSWLLLIPLGLQLCVFTVGVTLMLSAAYVYFRDIGQIWEVLAQALFYATPIVYPLRIVPDTQIIGGLTVRIALLCNPIAQIIEQSRRIIVDGTQGGLADVLGGGWLIVPYLITLGTFVVGVALYAHIQDTVVERL